MARRGKFVVETEPSGHTHFVLLASNGRFITRSEGYMSKAACLKAIASVQRLAAFASVVEDGSNRVVSMSERRASSGPGRNSAAGMIPTDRPAMRRRRARR